MRGNLGANGSYQRHDEHEPSRLSRVATSSLRFRLERVKNFYSAPRDYSGSPQVPRGAARLTVLKHRAAETHGERGSRARLSTAKIASRGFPQEPSSSRAPYWRVDISIE